MYRFILVLILISNFSHSQKKMKIPPYLKKGDTVAIVCTARKFFPEDAKPAIELLEYWGLKVKLGRTIGLDSCQLGGTDAERIADFQEMMDDDNIKAIWCARGGYGTVRMIDKLDYTKYKENPKWVIGYSDITAIHNQLNNEGSESIHAMMCTSLTDDLSKIEETLETFKCALFGKPLNYTIEGSNYNKTGNVTAPLVGGNLTLLHTMLGSKTSIDTSGKILFIEEIGEYKYHIDRMLQSLKRAGYFDNCKGLIVGDMTKMRKNTTPWGTSIEQLILDVVTEYDFPVLFDFPAGHEDDNRALILGRTIQLTVGKKESKVVF